MGDLIVLTPSLMPARRAIRHVQSDNILMFTGVRYVRLSEDDPALASVAPRRRSTRPRRGPRKDGDAKRA